MLIQSPCELPSNFTAPVPLHPSPKLVATSARNVKAFPDLPCDRAGGQSLRAGEGPATRRRQP